MTRAANRIFKQQIFYTEDQPDIQICLQFVRVVTLKRFSSTPAKYSLVQTKSSI